MKEIKDYVLSVGLTVLAVLILFMAAIFIFTEVISFLVPILDSILSSNTEKPFCTSNFFICISFIMIALIGGFLLIFYIAFSILEVWREGKNSGVL